MAEQQYQSRLVQILWTQLYPQIKEAATSHPVGKMFWGAIQPQIPEWLQQLDVNPELQHKIIAYLKEIVAMVEAENKGEALPPGEG